MLNKTVTIPKKITEGEEPVVVPRKEYEGLLKFYGAKKPRGKSPKRKNLGYPRIFCNLYKR